VQFELREQETVAVEGKREGSYLWKGAGRYRKKQKKIVKKKWFSGVPADFPVKTYELQERAEEQKGVKRRCPEKGPLLTSKGALSI